MSEFDSELRKFVARQNGDDLTPKIIFDMLIALDKDNVRRHGESVARQEQIVTLLDTHCDEAAVRDQRIGRLETWKQESTATCTERVLAIIEREHEARHAQHMEAHHTDDVNFQSRLVWFFASITGKIVLILIGVLAGILLNFAIYGRP